MGAHPMGSGKGMIWLIIIAMILLIVGVFLYFGGGNIGSMFGGMAGGF